MTSRTKKRPKPQLADGSWDWFTLEQAADYCGVKVRTIRTWVETGRVTHYKPSRRLLFLRADLDQVIEESKVS
jgi:excisionase family DNA binding protein